MIIASCGSLVCLFRFGFAESSTLGVVDFGRPCGWGKLENGVSRMA